MKYKTWNEDYGQTWRQQHPDYWKNYRRKKRMKPRPTPQIAISPLLLEALLQTDSGVKKEQLTLTKSVPVLGKKEQLTESFYLLKAKDLALWSLEARKKEQLPYCFNYN